MGRKKKKHYEPDNPEQSARFIELAERTKADNDKELFEKACKEIIKSKPKK
jgi:hypothetical protein